MDEVLNYLIERNAFDFEPLKFGYWKRMIKYRTKNDNYTCRKIFTQLVNEGYFDRIRINNKHFKYRFNPYGEIQERKLPIVIEW